MKQFFAGFTSAVRAVVYVLTVVSGLGILFMMGVTCADILLRIAGHPIVGAYDIVKITGAISMGCALPYTTAVKGHVAIEFLFQKMSRPWRILVDTIARLLSMSLFGLLTWRCIEYGKALRLSGEATATLEIPTFWILYVMAFSCGVVVLIIFDHMIHPGKEMIKP
ncbi:MAG: TRAP transporter small permease [Candidatus Omnitrophica bacterium]|nr:TRAP transporter small permease [Candidatus Omnitrophota bacterium]